MQNRNANHLITLNNGCGVVQLNGFTIKVQKTSRFEKFPRSIFALSFVGTQLMFQKVHFTTLIGVSRSVNNHNSVDEY